LISFLSVARFEHGVPVLLRDCRPSAALAICRMHTHLGSRHSRPSHKALQLKRTTVTGQANPSPRTEMCHGG
jgi:hypothetical protein